MGFATSVFAWGAQGHQLIAHLAQAQLSATARQNLDLLLAQEPGATLESIATWADEHRSPATGRWHYVNFPRDSCSYDALRDCTDGQCIVAAIDKQTAILASDAPDAKRLTALKYLVHLVGDIHQPLHAGCMKAVEGQVLDFEIGFQSRMAVDLRPELQRFAAGLHTGWPGMQHRSAVAETSHTLPIEQMGIDAGHLRGGVCTDPKGSTARLIHQLEGAQVEFASRA